MSKYNGKHSGGIFFILYLYIVSGSYLNAGVPANSPAGEQVPVSLYLCWHHQFQFAGYYAALEKGFYREKGLNVSLVEGGTSMNLTDLVVEKPGRYAVSNSDILIHRLQGKPLVVLAAIFQKSPIVLFSRAKSGIATPQDLIGRKVMLESKRKNPEMWATLQNEGVSPHLIHIIKGDFTREDYLNPNIDAISGYITDQPYLYQSRNIPYFCIKPSTYGIDFYGDCLFTSEYEVDNYPERVKAFREASLKGWEYAMKNPEEIIDLLIEKYSTRLSRAHLQFEAKEMTDLILPDLVEIGHMNPGRWKHIADTLVRLKMADPDYSLEGFIFNPNPVEDYTWVKWVVGITLLVALLGTLGVVILLSFNKRLQREVEFRKNTEEKLMIANQQAIAATRAKSEFLAKMSHEIRTPMNGVIGMASLLTHTSLTPEQKEFVDAIQISGNNLLRIINNILDFTKIEAGKMEIQEEVFSIQACIDETFTFFKPKAAEKNICLRYRIAPGVPQFIESDVTRLKQVLINLINNAIKFMDSGEIFVSVTSILIKNNRVTLKCSVKDEGIGIPTEKLDNLFDAFSQVDSSNSRKYEGTGLGLAISKQLVGLLGGNIWVKSKPGSGSTFFFTIDAAISDNANPNEPDAPPQEGEISAASEKEAMPLPRFASADGESQQGPLWILVVEDNKINQKLTHKLLTKMGYRVDVVDNGLEALNALEQKYYPLILMDIQMPEMDGVEATQIIMARFAPEYRPKIIALTANVLQGDKEKYMSMGMDDYISKPINFVKLNEVMTKWSRIISDGQKNRADGLPDIPAV